ncbi:trigger factor [Candidatus Odyssella acanthamoebae]|uniref:trigger factor n=1 Tax=Candidatus Odyssella acanthamoebae TaxID=91604 RepID=UPI00068D5BD6|nr:trigger factor [Candidatus Paracaedibacter acanthamoebae]
MKISRTSAQGLKQEYSVIVPSADMNNRIHDRLTVLGKKVKMAGFRPGMIPTTILKQRYGADATQDALETVVRSAITQISKENGIRQAAQPKISVESFDEDKDLEVKIEFEVLPTIDLKGFDKISLEKLIVDLPEAEIAKKVEEIVSNHQKFQPLAKERASKDGDLVHLDAVATVDGKAFKGFDKHMHVVVGSEEKLLSGALEDAVKGVKSGDTLQVSEKFPEDFSNKAVAGKDLKLELKVGKIEEPAKVELNDELAKEFGCENVDDFKKRVRETMEREYVNLSRMRLKRHLLDALNTEYTFDLPETMVENEFNAIWTRLQQELEQARQNGTLEDDDNRSEDDLKKEYRDISERRVRLGLVISEVAREKKIKVEDAEVRQAIFQEAMRYPNQVKEVFAFFQKNPQAVEQIAAPILEDKVVDFILTEVKLAEKKVSPEGLIEAIRGVVPGFEADDEGQTDTKAKKTSKGKTTKSKGE